MQYFICFETSSIENAGTNANLEVLLEGEKTLDEETIVTSSGWVSKPNLPGDELEQGMINGWDVAMPDLGNLKKLTVKSDGSGNKPGWHLAKVVVAEVGGARGSSFVFPFNCWFTEDNGLQHSSEI